MNPIKIVTIQISKLDGIYIRKGTLGMEFRIYKLFFSLWLISLIVKSSVYLTIFLGKNCRARRQKRVFKKYMVSLTARALPKTKMVLYNLFLLWSYKNLKSIFHPFPDSLKIYKHLDFRLQGWIIPNKPNKQYILDLLRFCAIKYFNKNLFKHLVKVILFKF